MLLCFMLHMLTIWNGIFKKLKYYDNNIKMQLKKIEIIF